MSIYRTTPTEVTTVFVKLSDTSTTSILSAIENSVGVETVRFCNTSGSGVTITLDAYDGTTTFNLINGETIAANSRLTYDGPIQLDSGMSLRATAGTGAVIDVVMTYLAPTDAEI